MTFVILALVASLAYANGSNDNSKGVATLVGYGTAIPRRALFYAALTTAAGAAVSFWFAGGLLKSFSTGLFAKGTPLDQPFFVSVLIGAFGWVIFATFTGLPVSTTHAIMGSLIGAGLVAFGHERLLWATLGRGFIVPLVLGPVLGVMVVYLLAWPVTCAVRWAAVKRTYTPELSAVSVDIPPHGAATAVVHEAEVRVQAGGSSLADLIHWISGGLIGFARGWNDTPKIAALSLLALPHHVGAGFAIVTIAMMAGGLISGRRVLETLARKLTPLPLPESVTASLTTAGLVCLASWNGLPVSTTHVSTGSIIGAGLKNDPAGVNWKKVVEIVLSWVITLPAAGLVAALMKSLIR